MQDTFITVITPTYNRNSELERLYDSLIRQNDKGFCWLVVDDGSTDETEKTIKRLQHEKQIEIKYIWKKNEGKHTALNLGIEIIKTPLTIIVDSDDYLSDQAISIIREYHEKYFNIVKKEKLCGYSFLRAFSDGKVNFGEFSENERIDSYRNQRINKGDLGDKAEVFYTEILKKYLFPVFDNEKFMPEDAVWLKMSGPYQMVHINKIIYFCDYLEGGLTKTGRFMKIYSPYGMMYRSAVYLRDTGINRKTRIKMLLLYVIYEYFAKNNDAHNGIAHEIVREKKEKCRFDKQIDYYLLKIPGYMIYRNWMKKYIRTNA